MDNQNQLQSLSDEVKASLKLTQKRFLFNVDVIEQKYCRKSSGLVYNLKKDKFIFDKEVCTVNDDETLVKMISRQKKSHFQIEFGSAIICSPSAAPEDKKKDEVRLRKLNQFFKKINDTSTFD